MAYCQVCDGHGYKLGESDFEKGFHPRGPKSFEKSKIPCKFCKGTGKTKTKVVVVKQYQEEPKKEMRSAMANKKTEIIISTKLAEQVKAFNQTPERVKLDFLRAVSINPILKDCDTTSLILGIAKLRDMGMSLDNLDGEGALIPYKDRNTGLMSAQIQVQWKGIRKTFRRDVEGSVDLFAMPIKKGDVKSWNRITGEMTFTEQFTSTDFEVVAERDAKETIGFIGVLTVDKDIYGQENFATYKTVADIARWAKEYSRTKEVKADWYGEKTVAKAVFRKYKHRLKFKNDKVAKDMLTYDQSVVRSDTEVEYIDNPKNKGQVKVVK